MSITDHNNQPAASDLAATQPAAAELTATVSRRAVLQAGLSVSLSAGLGAVIALAFATPAQAKRRRRRRGRRRSRTRAIRRQAIRRFRRRGGSLQSHARKAVRQGQIRPLREVMAVVQRRSNAEVLDVDLHQRPDGWIYALRILTAQGRVRDVFLDARTLDLVQVSAEGAGSGVPLPSDLDNTPARRANDPFAPTLPRQQITPASPAAQNIPARRLPRAPRSLLSPPPSALPPPTD